MRRAADETIGVVGGGIVGLAVARRLALTRPAATVRVFEKEPALARHQSGHNSGVAHAGVYYAPGTLKATLCRRGIGLLEDYCAARGLPYDQRGKLVVARNAIEVERLRELERRSLANGVPGIQWLDAGELVALEPGVRGVAALLSPTTAIVDFAAVAMALADDVRRAGGQVHLDAEVTSIAASDTAVVVRAGGEPVRLDALVVCAGLQSDSVARLAGEPEFPAIVPFRGEYLRLRPHARDRVRRLIYPVPDPAYPFLGVHVTPRVDGEVDIGPNAVLALAREGYRRGDVSAAHLGALVTSPAFRRLARRHWRTGVRELTGSLVRRVFLAEARSYLPWLRPGDVRAGPTGVRAQAVDADGTLVDDFRIGGSGRVLTVRNAPSPAATSSLAIAEHVVASLERQWPAPTRDGPLDEPGLDDLSGRPRRG